MRRPIQILVVEDEEAIRSGLVDVFVYHGYEVDVADNGHDGLEKALSGRFDLVLLDIMLPELDGYSICNRVRAVDRDIPIVMLTAKNSDPEIIDGLKLGADDYVGKPFSVAQLVARIEAVLRRSKASGSVARKICLSGDIEIDTLNLEGTRGDEALSFTRREIDILSYLGAHSDRPVSREELLAKIWGYAKNLEIETRTVDIHIAKLRRKIEHSPKDPQNLRTVRGAGYRLITVD